MIVLFCLDTLRPRQPDDYYLTEADAAGRHGFDIRLIDHDALCRGDVRHAVRSVPEQPDSVVGLYRGWMVRAEKYDLLYQALAAKNIHLINDPDAYRHCHHLPDSYTVIERHTPRSVWLPLKGEIRIEEIMGLLRPFGDRPLVLKDYVKSRKHEWHEACFIPSASDRAAVERVVRRFLELQDDDLVGGLVFREFVEFEPLTTHTRSGMPLTREYRLFFFDGRLLLCAEYWEEGEYAGDGPPLDLFTELAQKVRSRFFTMDVARRVGGEWMVVELGDGQVAGMPERADVDEFYGRLAQ